MSSKIILAFVLMSQFVIAQPIASAKEMGVKVRYFLQYGLTMQNPGMNYETNDKVSVPVGDSEILGAGTFYLAGVGPFWGWNFGVGAEISNRHEIAFRYENGILPYRGNGFADFVDLTQLAVDYRFLFLKNGWVKPYVGLGFDYTTLDYPGSYQLDDGGKRKDGRIVGKGGHAEAGVAFYYSRFGVLIGPTYRFFDMDRVAVEEDGFDLHPTISFQIFGLETLVRFYF